VQWVAGFFGFKENSAGPICVQGSYNTPKCVFQEGPNNDMVSYAAFAQGTYTPPVLDDALHFLVGVRYNSDEVTSSDFETAVFPLASGNIYRPYLNKTAQKGTYKLGVNYDLSANNLLYVSNSTGYRAFNFQYGEYPYVPPETIHAWEIGSKNQFFQKRLQVNVDAFWYDYYGSERSEQTYPPPQLSFLPFGDITSYSAGHSRFKGLNFTVNAAVTSDDHVNLAVQYIDAKYIDFVLPAIFKNTAQVSYSGAEVGTVGDLSGDPISQVPAWAGTAAYDHEWNVFGGTVTGRIDAQFAKRTPMTDADPGTIEDVERPGYVQGDLLLKYSASGDRWAVSAWCRNFTNKITWNSAGYGTTTGAAGAGLVTALLNPPRTYGVTVTAKVGHP
jgi:iron complex outermembrane receptor protein